MFINHYFSKLKKYFDLYDIKNRNVNTPVKTTLKNNSKVNVNDKLRSIYGNQFLDLTIMYERWAMKDTWLLETEAIPLLLGIDPEKAEETYKNNVELNEKKNELHIHATDCINQQLLKVLNSECDSGTWRVIPVDIYQWAKISRIVLPDELKGLMDYVSGLVKQTSLNQESSSENSNKGNDNLLKDREMILGMTLAIVSKYSAECLNSHGKININQVMKIIDEKKSFWLGDYELSMTNQAIKDLLEHWIKNTKAQDKKLVG